MLTFLYTVKKNKNNILSDFLNTLKKTSLYELHKSYELSKIYISFFVFFFLVFSEQIYAKYNHLQ